MIESNHNLDQDYNIETTSPQNNNVDEIVKDIDISPLLYLPQKCLQCCYCNPNINYSDSLSIGGSSSTFSELTQQLINSHLDGGSVTPSTTLALDERDRQHSSSNINTKRPIYVNRNIFQHYLLVFLQGSADSLWRGTVLSIFLVKLTIDSNGRTEYIRTIGYLEGMFTLGKIIAKLFYPDDAITDKAKHNNVRISQLYRQEIRDETLHTPGATRQNSFTLKVAGFILVVTATSNIIILSTLPNYSQDIRLFYQLLPLLFMYGYSSCVLLSSSASHALFRESSSTGSSEDIRKQRKRIERPLMLVSNIVGSLITIIIFSILGNVFTIRNLRVVWFVGSALEVIVGLLSFGFSERYHVIPEANVVEEEVLEESLATDEILDNEVDDMDETDRDLQQTIDRVLDDSTTAVNRTSPLGESPLMESSTTLGEPLLQPSSVTVIENNIGSKISKRLSRLPLILMVLVVALFIAGGALFHAYWPIFFNDVVKMKPIQLQSLYIFIPLTTLLFDTSYRSSNDKESSRISISIVYRIVGATFILIIGIEGYDKWDHGSSIGLSILFVLRLALVISARHVNVFENYLSKIIGMDHIPIWKQILEMLTLVVWGIFAALGGVILESKSLPDSGYSHGEGGGGYGYDMRLTGIFEFIGVLLMFVILICRHYNIGVKDRG